MQILILVLVALIGLSHIGFGLVEMFGKSELQAKAFDFAIEDLKIPSTKLALKNQGIYNIAFGLITGYMLGNQVGWQTLVGLMSFVLIVGIYGGATVTRKIYFVQALPALITLILLMIFK